MKSTEISRVDSLRERLIFLATDIAPGRGRYEYLEVQTGISGARWKNLFLRKLMPPVEMILSIQELRPQFVEWLLFGTVSASDRIVQASPDDASWSGFAAHEKYVQRQRAKVSKSQI